MYQSPYDKLNHKRIVALSDMSAKTKDLAEQAYVGAERDRALFSQYILPMNVVREQQKRLEPEEEKGKQQDILKGIDIESLRGKYTYMELLEMYRDYVTSK